MLLAQSDTDAGMAILGTLAVMGVVCGIISSIAWSNKGGSSWTGFLLGFFLGVIGLLVALLGKPSVPLAPQGWVPRPGEVVKLRTYIQIKSSTNGIPAGTEVRVLEVEGPKIFGELGSGERHHFFIEHLVPKPQTLEVSAAPLVRDDDIRRLAQLRDDGLITAEEYESKKRDLLGL
jgi:hypothetical protein